MLESNWPLLVVLVLGLIFSNDLIAAAAAIVLVARALDLQIVLGLFERRALEFGLVLLMLSVLTPLAKADLAPRDLWRNLASPLGITAIIGGAFAALISSPGVDLMQKRPEVVIGLMVGSILAVIFFRGIPVGPLTASGVAAILLRMLGLLGKN